MDLSQFLNHPQFQTCVRRLGLGETLFTQGETSQTLYIILEGKVRLLSEARGRQYTIAILGQGEFLGEKALVAEEPYERHFTAQAITPLTILELGPNELAEVQKQSPYLMKMILTRSFEMAEERLDRANQLVKALRFSNNRSRVIHLLQYLAKTIGRKDGEGVKVPEVVDHVYFHLEMDKEVIESELENLVARGLVRKRNAADYVIPSLDVLIAALEIGADSVERTAFPPLRSAA